MADQDDYEVGYGKPPKESRFKKGVSGNPKGRPAGARNILTICKQVGNELVTVSENGRTRQMTKVEATVRQMYLMGMKGDHRSMRELLRLQSLAEQAEASTPDHHEVDEQDRLAMVRFRARMKAMNGKQEEPV